MTILHCREPDSFTEKTPREHDFISPASYFDTDMKRAFVLRLTPAARPASGRFEGRVEEVDSGKSTKFVSVEEFLHFLQQCLDDGETAQD